MIYATPAYIEKNPQAVQKVVDAFVRGLKWIAGHSAEDIAKLMPEEYALGNLPIYIKALSVSKPMFSPDGHFEPGAVETAHAVLKVFDPAVAGATIDLSQDLQRQLREEGACREIASDRHEPRDQSPTTRRAAAGEFSRAGSRRAAGRRARISSNCWRAPATAARCC